MSFSRPGTVLALLALLGPLLGGCVALRPLEEVRSAAGPGAYAEIDGLSLHYVDRGEGEPVVLLHGFGASAWSWRHVLADLDSDYRMVALDLPGFGASERPRELVAYERTHQLDLVLGLLDHLGLERVHLVGHSFGGALAITFAHRHPERLESLVLVDAAAPDYPEKRRNLFGGFPPAVWLWIRGVALRRPMVARVLRRSFADDALVDGDLVEAYRDRLRVEGAVRAYRGLTRPPASPHPPVPYEEIRVPTVAIWGADDAVIPAPKARAAVDRFPDARFVELPGCGHAPMEECPEALAREMRTFLDERRGEATATGARPAPTGDRSGAGSSPRAGGELTGG